jgi:hypothetical protein
MSFTQIKRIREIDQTEEQAIASYGAFVNLLETTKDRVQSSKRKDWSTDRVLLSKAYKAIPVIHQTIHDKFGKGAVHKAIGAHPFK